MKALTYHGPHDVRVETLPDPERQDETDLLLRVTRSTICGSDLHLWHGAMQVAEPGFAIGHELDTAILCTGRWRTARSP